MCSLAQGACIVLDARLAARLAPEVARILVEETGLPPEEAEFIALAAQYTEIPTVKSS